MTDRSSRLQLFSRIFKPRIFKFRIFKPRIFKPQIFRALQTQHLPRLRQRMWQLVVLYYRRSAQSKNLAKNSVKNASIQLKLAQALLQAGQPNAAIDRCESLYQTLCENKTFCETLISQGSDQSLHLRVAVQTLLAEAYQAIGQRQKAIETHLQAIDEEPQNAELYHRLGKCYGQQEEWLQAIEAYQKALELDTNNPWVHYSLGIAWVKTGQWDLALSSLKFAQRSLPREAWISYFLGESYLAKGETASAIQGYRKTLRRSPWMMYLRDCLAYAEHVQKQDQRIAAWIKTVQSSSDVTQQSTQLQQATQSQQSNKPQHSKKRRMLMITPYPSYPPTTGAIARMFHEMKAMGEFYDLTLVSFIFQKRDFWIEKVLHQYCEFAITIVMGDCPPPVNHQPQISQPRLIHRYSSERMAHVLDQLKQIPFDFVLIDFIQMAQYADRFPNAFRILGEHNIESELLRRSAQLQTQLQAQSNGTTNLQQLATQHASLQSFLGGFQEASILADYERQTWPKFQLRMVVSEPDRHFLDQTLLDQLDERPLDQESFHLINTIGKTIVVSNGIDTKNIQPLPDNGNRIVLFIGTLSYYPNIDGVEYFTQEILPLIWEIDPTVQFWVAGAEPPEALLALASDRRIQIIANPEDMTVIAQQCCITVVPLRIGSGTRIKILHAMALGLPIVTTSLGCEGIDGFEGQSLEGQVLWIRDRPEAFASATLALLEDADRRQQFRQQGRKLVEQKYDWASIFATAIDRFERENPELDNLELDNLELDNIKGVI